jgi:hypothetical protein
MNTIDPTKKPVVTPPPSPPPAAPSKSPKTGIASDFVPQGPKPNFGALFPPPLKGPGVAGGVFGNTTPDPGKMTDAQLAAGIDKLGNAMRSDVGKVNDADATLYGAMVREAAIREALLLDSKKPIASMDNKELFHHVIAFDLAKASGMKLTPAQEKRYAELNDAMKTRGKVDYDKEIKELVHTREKLMTKIALHCSAAATGAFGLATHIETPAILASGAVIYHAAKEGHLGEAALEGGLFLAGRIPLLHKAAEIASTTTNGVECAAATFDLHQANKQIAQLEAQKAKAAGK